MTTASGTRPRRRLGALAAAAAGTAALVAATPAIAQDTKTIQVPAELDISWQESSEGGFSNCTAVAMLRWKIVPEAIPGSTRLAHFTDTKSPNAPVSKVGREPFQWDNFVAGGTRVFTAPPGYHQVLIGGPGAKSRPLNLGRSDCSDFAALYQARYAPLYVEVKVPADAPVTTTPPEATTPPGEAGERTRYKPILAAKWGKRTIRLNRTRTVAYNAPILLRGTTRPALKGTRVLVQRRIVAKTKKGRVVRWKTIRRIRTTSTGSFRWVFRARKLGRDTLRITVPSSTTRLSANSGQVRLNVTRRR